MNTQNLLKSSGAFPTYLNWKTSVTRYVLPDKQSAQYIDFSCRINEFMLYQEPHKCEQTVTNK